MDLTQTQTTIIDTLREEGLTVQGWEVKQPQPPVVVVCPALPSVETTAAGVTHGKPFMTNWTVQILAGKGTDVVVRDALNDMIGRALLALRPYMRDIEVESPKFTEGDPKYLGAEITASIAIDMQKEE
ncbi:hypothetical protein CH249_14660 [Rhodococcus sp. 05-2255-3B1]|uniref:hypothetical protein n=1 Tax=unclassified Rhodococcus (in: high G+C Gram-positive bacteria) TaxID=192944 RepID=UPI000B9C69B6|nr:MULTISPECIES: hypothetical protein [unclassified Rhodococcus (in: high G+C Gram-positive bacteria)]OZE03055.1 hypothetical protein CH250_22725 [Rhodococcus sp. 05-2255-3C]OZE09445.1 hypothetical protein CH249_14660 [Rhodococcus sp. 05-2255-3B1]